MILAFLTLTLRKTSNIYIYMGTYLTAEIYVSIIARRTMPARKFGHCLFATRQFSFIAATANSVERPAVAIWGNMPAMLCPTGLTVPALL